MTCLPKNWKLMPIGELAVVDSGFAFKSADFLPEHARKLGVPVIRMSDLRSGRVLVDDAARIPTSVAVSADKFSLKPGDFLFGMSGSLTNYGLVRSEDLPAYLNQRVGRLRAGENVTQE